MLVFTPPFSEGALGTVLVKRRPLEPVTPHHYRILLADRIQAMVGDADPGEAVALLRELAVQEGLTLTSDLTKAGETLAEFSQTLRAMAAFPVEPIDPSEFQDDSETLDAISDETLEEWVMALLR